MRPRSNTRTMSAFSAVERRWAIITVVLPSDSRSSAWESARSVSGSTALVASSRISRPDPALGRVGQAAQQFGEGGLARPGLAHDGHVPAGRQIDVDVMQHLATGAVAVADALGPHRQRAWRQVDAGRGLDHLDREVEDP